MAQVFHFSKTLSLHTFILNSFKFTNLAFSPFFFHRVVSRSINYNSTRTHMTLFHFSCNSRPNLINEDTFPQLPTATEFLVHLVNFIHFVHDNTAEGGSWAAHKCYGIPSATYNFFFLQCKQKSSSPKNIKNNKRFKIDLHFRVRLGFVFFKSTVLTTTPNKCFYFLSQFKDAHHFQEYLLFFCNYYSWLLIFINNFNSLHTYF